MALKHQTEIIERKKRKTNKFYIEIAIEFISYVIR